MEQDCPHSFPSVFLPLSLDKALDCFSSSYPTPCGSFITVVVIREPLPVAWLFSARVALNVDIIFHVFMRGGGLILLLHHLDLPPPPASTFKGKYDKYACSLVRPLCLPASETTSSDLQSQTFVSGYVQTGAAFLHSQEELKLEGVSLAVGTVAPGGHGLPL